METTNNNNKTYIWIAVGCLGIVVCGIAVGIFGFGGLVWLGLQSPENVNITISTPTEVNVGDDVELRITITNTGTDPIQISSMDISLNYLNGFVIERTTPPFRESFQYDNPVTQESFQTYSFNQSLASNDTIVVIFYGTAAVSGDFNGAIDVCIDSDFNCVQNTTRTLIK